MIWKLVSLLLNNESPIVVVLSESMSPGFEREEVLWLRSVSIPQEIWQSSNGIKTPYLSYTELLRSLVIVHWPRGAIIFDDVGLYRRNQYYIEPEYIMSCAFLVILFFGMITILVNFKPLILGLLALSVFITRE